MTPATAHRRAGVFCILGMGKVFFQPRGYGFERLASCKHMDGARFAREHYLDQGRTLRRADRDPGRNNRGALL